MKRSIIITAVTLVLALALINFLASRHFARLDLTQNRDYTLAPATKDILRHLKDVVTLRLYFTKDMPAQLLPFNRLVHDTIDEFRRVGGQNIRVEFVDPASSEDTEREAVITGITPVQLNVQGQDKIEVAKVYIGMALLHGDRREVLPVVAYPQNLEYDLTSRILKLTREKSPTVAWWGPEGGGQSFQQLRKNLEQRYTVVAVDPKSPALTADQHAALVLISPRALGAPQRMAINQYLSAGGQVVALVDTVEISPTMQVSPQTSGLEEIFLRFGISVANDLLLDRANAPAVFSGGVVSYQIPYPFWLKLLPRNLDTESRIVGGLDNIVLPWTSALTIADPAIEGVQVRVLGRTTEFAKAQTFSEGYHLDPEAADSALRSEGGQVYDVIALAESAGGGKLMVVGTSRLVQDQFVQQFPQNAAMVENAVDILTFGDALVGIRSRGQLAHPVEELSSLAERVIQYANMAGAVILVIALAGMVMSYRRRRRRALQLVYSK